MYAKEPAAETYKPISETANYSAPVASADENTEPAAAQRSSTSGQCGDNVYWSFDEATGTLTISGTGDSVWGYDPSWAEDARLPPWYGVREKIETLVFSCQVSRIGNYSFADCVKLIEVKLPDSLQDIGTHAFSGCSSLPVISIPEGVTFIHGGAFENCTSLAEVKLPDSVNVLEDSVFFGCNSLTKASLPNEISELPNNTFGKCEKLTAITLPDSITRIGSYAFGECTNLQTIIIPNSVTSIEDSAFYGCIRISKIELPTELKTIGYSAFENCASLVEVSIPDGVSNLGAAAFRGCSSLSSITIPGSISRIEDFAFDGCENLKEVHLYDIAGWCNIELGLHGASPFLYGASLYNLDSLVTNLTIPDTVSEINDLVFQGCSSISSLTIPSNVGGIGQYAFSYCSNLIAVAIRDGVDIVDEYAFSCCDNLQTVILPGSDVSLETGAFMDCPSLKNITLPTDLDTISNHLFSGCSALQSITLPDGISTIGEDAFYGCSNLSIVNFPQGLSSIGEEAFWGCSLAHISIPASIKTISDYVFAGNDMTNVVIPSGITSIGMGAFNGCSALQSITLPDGISTIGEDAFYGCSNLSIVNFPQGLSSIGEEAFWGCSLAHISIPASIKTISDYVFAGNDMTNVVIPSGITSIGMGAFNNCFYMASITIPTSVTIIEDAFLNCQALDDVYYLGSREMWNSILISSDNDRLLDANIHFAIETVEGDDSGLGNGTDSAISNLYITDFSDREISAGMLGSGIVAYFNKNITMGDGSKRISIMNTETRTGKSFAVSDDRVYIAENALIIRLDDLNICPGKDYYINIDNGAIKGTDGDIFYGLKDHTSWVFTVSRELKISGVDYSWAKKGWIIRKDDTSKPPIPNGTDEQYADLLQSWAEDCGGYLNYSDALELLDYPAYLPVTDVNNQPVLLNDNATTVRQVIEDIVFVSELQSYIDDLDAELAAIENSINAGSAWGQIAEIMAAEVEAYEMAAGWYEQIDKYMSGRDEDSNFFLSLTAPIAYNALTSTFKGSIGTVAKAQLSLIENESLLLTINGEEKYSEFKDAVKKVGTASQGLGAIYSAYVGGDTSKLVKLGSSLLVDYFAGSDNGIISDIANAYKEISSAKSAAQLCMFLGSTIGMFPMVIDLYNDLNGSRYDQVKAAYFIADYYIADKDPELYNTILGLTDGFIHSENYMWNHYPSYAWDYALALEEGERSSDPVVANWSRFLNTGSMADIDETDSAVLRRDITNYATILRFAKSINVNDTIVALIDYLKSEGQAPDTVGISVSCPVRVNIYDLSGNLVASLSSEDDEIADCQYGTMYLLGENGETKYFLLSSENYKIEIVPYADGTMDVSITNSNEDGTASGVYYESVELRTGMTITTDSLVGTGSSLNVGEAGTSTTVAPEDEIPVMGISIDAPSELAIGESYSITAIVAPETATDKSLAWSSSNSGVIDVSGDGVITAVSAGNATITAMAANGISASVEVSAYSPAQSVSLDMSSLRMCVGEEYNLAVNVNPSNATHPIKWYSSAGSVAFVDENGSVYAQSEGIAVITADIDGVSASVTVTVSEEPISIILYQSDTSGDRIKVDMLNNSLYSGYTGSVFISLYDADGRMLSTSELPLALGAGTHTTGYIPITNWDGHSELTAKAFTLDGQMLPVSSSTEINLIGG